MTKLSILYWNQNNCRYHTGNSNNKKHFIYIHMCVYILQKLRESTSIPFTLLKYITWYILMALSLHCVMSGNTCISKDDIGREHLNQCKCTATHKTAACIHVYTHFLQDISAEYIWLLLTYIIYLNINIFIFI